MIKILYGNPDRNDSGGPNLDDTSSNHEAPQALGLNPHFSFPKEKNATGDVSMMRSSEPTELSYIQHAIHPPGDPYPWMEAFWIARL